MAVALRFHMDAARTPPTLSLGEVRDGVIAPLLVAALGLLSGAELLGRSILELRFGSLPNVMRFRPETSHPRDFPVDLPLGGEVSLPLATDAPDKDLLADQWRDDLGRQLRLQTLRGR